MKKIFLSVAVLTLLATSCTITKKSATTAKMPTNLHSSMIADLDVSDERITYTMNPSMSIRKGGIANVKNAVRQEALSKYGNADVLVNEEFSISSRRGIFWTKIKSITVTGRPAKYINFRSANDSVWSSEAYLKYANKNLIKD
ncbi:MAG: hypothetical protein J6L02_08570 [Bacteroidales bacterium]|nr:hypothetical protein [Bacteroidales bacterium]